MLLLLSNTRLLSSRCWLLSASHYTKLLYTYCGSVLNSTDKIHVSPHFARAPARPASTCNMATSFFNCASCLVGKRSLSMTLMATSRPSWRCLPMTSHKHAHSWRLLAIEIYTIQLVEALGWRQIWLHDVIDVIAVAIRSDRHEWNKEFRIENGSMPSTWTRTYWLFNNNNTTPGVNSIPDD